MECVSYSIYLLLHIISHMDYSFMAGNRSGIYIYKIVAIIWIVQRHTKWQLDTKTIENRHNFPWTSAVAFPSLSSGPRQFSPNAWLFRKVIIAKLYEINGQSKYAICVRVCMLVHGAWCTMHTSWDMMMNDERVFCIEFSEAIVE